MDPLDILAIGVARGLLVLLFLPFSAFDKMLNFEAAVAQARHAVQVSSIARVLIVAGCTIEIVMPLAILSGVLDRLAALILAGYCILTALLWKRFWTAADFRLKGPSRGREVFWDFLKNLAVAGGFLMLAFGTRATEAHRFFEHPFSSSHPYTAVESEVQRP